MINTYKKNSEVWMDIDNGTPEEIHKLMDQYSIHPFVAKELSTFTPRPRIEFHDEYIYCIIHFPAWKHTHSKDDVNQEVDFIIGDDIAIEIKSTDHAKEKHCHGLRALQEEKSFKQFYLVSHDTINRVDNNIHIMHWKDFLQKLWSDELNL